MTPDTLNQRALLGAILKDSTAVVTMCIERGITDEHFTDENRLVWRAVDSLYRDSQYIDLVSVQSALRGNGGVDYRYLDGCMNDCPTSAHAPFYLSQVIDAKLRADMKAQAHVSLDMITAEDAEPRPTAEILAEIQGGWTALSLPEPDTRTLGEAGHERLTAWAEAEEPEGRVVWPLGTLNEAIGRLSDEYVFLAASESVGKTAFACQMAEVNARNGLHVSLNSLESKRDKVAQRFIANIGQVNTINLRRKNAAQSQWARAHAAVCQLKNLPVAISDCGMTIDQVCAWGKGEKAKGSQLLIIDNMRHIRPTRRYQSPVEQFRDFSLRLKWLKDDTGIPLVVLHHLNDAGDVSWSKDIRRDADILLFIQPDEEESVSPSKANDYKGYWRVLLDVQKNREGRKGFTVPAEFEKEYQRFREVVQNAGVDPAPEWEVE